MNNNNKILLVENDLHLNRSLTDLLTSKAYQVHQVHTLHRAYQLLTNSQYNLVIIDRILDDGDGIELVAYINQVSFRSKILMLTKKSQTADKIKGLETGADDYLAKPFSYTEFILRVKKLMRMEKIKNRNYLKAGPIKLYLDQGLVVINDSKIRLRKKEIQILAYLIRFQNTVVSRQAILNHIWHKTEKIPSFNTIDVYLRRIRMKFGKYSYMIETVRGFGYRLTNKRK